MKVQARFSIRHRRTGQAIARIAEAARRHGATMPTARPPATLPARWLPPEALSGSAAPERASARRPASPDREPWEFEP